jgi:P-type conjugative transfer protein TrbG
LVRDLGDWRNLKVKSIWKLFLIAALVAPLLLAQKKATADQTKKSDKARVKRVPPAEVDSSSAATSGEALETPNQRRKRLAVEKPNAPSQDEYPFTQAIDELEEPVPNPPSKRFTWTAPTQTSVKKIGSPKDSPPKTGVATSATANDAVEVSNRWKETRDTPAEGKDGRVVFADGAGLPTIVCAPLRLCIVELQAGEKLTGEPQIGDSVRWGIEPASYGAGELVTPMIVIKPKAIGLDTNLVITTDRHAYYLRLMSSMQDYVAKVSFDYPDDARAKWSEAVKKPSTQPEGIPVVSSLEGLNSNYRITGDESIRPIMVLDDGVHTYIRMNPAVLHREAPVLAVIGPDGKAEMVNYRVQGSVYVVDRLFDRGRLILGSGRKARKADIVRGPERDRRLFDRDPFRSFPTETQKESKPQ